MSVIQDPMLSPLQHQPGVLVIHLLNRCNLRCRHCYMEAVQAGGFQLPADLVIRSISEVKQLGINTIYLSGGEPFLFPNLSEVLSSASLLPDVTLRISTNGTLIGPNEAEYVKKNGAAVQVSIDGPESYHDSFRGCIGAFSQAVKGIQHLVAAGVSVTLVTTVTQDNADCLPWLAEWAVDIGVERISVQPLLRLGRGAAISDKKLTERQLSTLFLRLSDLGYRYKTKGLTFSLAYRTRFFLDEHPCAAYVCDGSRCHRGVSKEIKKLVIREDGTVFPEIANLHPRFALGNIGEGTLSGLVESYFIDGYSQFQHICRTVYDEVMPKWASPIVPWDEIVAERSWSLDAQRDPKERKRAETKTNSSGIGRGNAVIASK